jgi:hypothetical protein
MEICQGALSVVSAFAFAAAATTLSVTFDWPNILRVPASVVLPAFDSGGPGLVWTWFATAWTYGLLAVPILLLPAALGLRDHPALRVATYVGAASRAQHQFGGALLGEHLGQLLVIGWSVTLSVIVLRSNNVPRWLGAVGLRVPPVGGGSLSPVNASRALGEEWMRSNTLGTP